ncbi:YraN family protein [Vibrio coralliilyticus]|uniref:YraN family protein n=1 Tax=Vibrio coralliilyticus TaxID=190893 RepID=UPI000C16A16A|nr:YraN family protein [Vibrio coralliilyticus]
MVWLSKRQSGEHYEALAEQYLIRQGLSPIERNFHSKSGELDLIMQEGSTIVFVEVRYRSNQHYGHAAETVTQSKMHKLIKTANVWLMKQGKSAHTTDFRFDLVAMHQQGKQIEWIKNAITQG